MKCLECKNYWTNGKDESCDVRGWDFAQDECPDFRDKEPKTNGDLIRSMTDMQLAVWLAAMLGVNPFDGAGNDFNKWYEWLTEDAE